MSPAPSPASLSISSAPSPATDDAALPTNHDKSNIENQKSEIKNPDEPRHRRGNIARLSKALRDKVNQMLDDGLPYTQIIRNLGPEGQGLTPPHIGSWKAGGYRDYLREQQRIEICRPSHDFLASFLTQCQGTEAYQAAPKLAASLLCETFVDFGPETVRRALQENPMNAFRLLNALARILSGGLRCERFLAQKTAYEASAKDPDQVKGLVPKTFDQINEHLNLM